MLENFVCGFVSASAFPPAFDNSSVVSQNFCVSASGGGWDEGEDKEPKANGFCPTDVPAVSLPTW